MRLSFILPVYNVAAYLTECVESICTQHLNEADFEIILVDDGSNDNSWEVAQELVVSHKNIVASRQKNQGVSVARNAGLKIAKGNYVIFIDPDDYLIPDTVPVLLQLAEADRLDILKAAFIRVNEEGQVLEKSAEKEVFVSGKVVDGMAYVSEVWNPRGDSVWRYMIRREFLVNNGLFFREGLRYAEDVEFVVRMFFYAVRVSDSAVCFYVYRRRASSAIASMDMDRAFSLIAVLAFINDKVKNGKADAGFKRKLSECVVFYTRVLTWYIVYVPELYCQKQVLLKEFRRFLPLQAEHNRSGRFFSGIMNICPGLYLRLRHMAYKLRR